LSRLAAGRHGSLQIQKGDTVVLSLHTIPGNEEMTHSVINLLFERGADVYYDPMPCLHTVCQVNSRPYGLFLHTWLRARLSLADISTRAA
jgi:mRNA degradation ribonuclease J1/J2